MEALSVLLGQNGQVLALAGGILVARAIHALPGQQGQVLWPVVRVLIGVSCLSPQGQC